MKPISSIDIENASEIIFSDKNKFYDELRPYEIDSDEVAKWRLVMELNELGRAFILLHKYLYYEQD